MNALAPIRPAPDTHALTYQDEEIVIRHRRGESPGHIATRLGYPLPTVINALNRAVRMGVSLRRFA